jgi:hypothetical protein
MKTQNLLSLILVSQVAVACNLYAEIHANVSSGSLLIDTRVSAPPPVYTAKDPDRVFNGVRFTLHQADPEHGLVAFCGKIVEVQNNNGLRMLGFYSGCNPRDGAVEFFVTNFPYPMAENEIIGDHLSDGTFFMAMVSGTHAYHTVVGGSRTLRMLDYGEIYVPTPEEIAAATRAALAKKAPDRVKAAAAADKALQMNEDLAAKGDSYGLLRMGERYRDGDGVEKDLAKAKDYLQKATVAGSPTAADELKRLSP